MNQHAVGEDVVAEMIPSACATQGHYVPSMVVSCIYAWSVPQHATVRWRWISSCAVAIAVSISNRFVRSADIRLISKVNGIHMWSSVHSSRDE